MPIPLDLRTKPAGVKVHVSTGAGIDVTWSDGHASHFDFLYLRDLCPCAMCDDERRKQEDVRARTGGFSAPALPMFKPRVTARGAKPIGNYALQIEFSDGHTTGIYSYGYLRSICPCADCERNFRSGQSK